MTITKRSPPIRSQFSVLTATKLKTGSENKKGTLPLYSGSVPFQSLLSDLN